jgi:hypothetical protein
MQDVAEFSQARRRDLFHGTAGPIGLSSSSGGSASRSDSSSSSGSSSSLHHHHHHRHTSSSLLTGPIGAMSSSASASLSELQGGSGVGGGPTIFYYQLPTRSEIVAIARPIVVGTATNGLTIGRSAAAMQADGDGGSGLSRAEEARLARERIEGVLTSPWTIALEAALFNLSALTDALYAHINGAPARGPYVVCCRLPDPAGLLSTTTSQAVDRLFANINNHIASVQGQ